MQSILENIELRSLILIGTLTISLALAASVVYVIMPQSKTYIDIRHSRDTISRLLGEDKTIQQNIEEHQQKLNSVRQKLHGKFGDLTTDRIESAVIRELYDISTRTNTALLSIRPGTKKVVEQFEETQFKIELHTNYKNLYKWLTTLQNELGFVVINQYELITTENPTSGLAISLSLSAYIPRP